MDTKTQILKRAVPLMLAVMFLSASPAYGKSFGGGHGKGDNLRHFSKADFIKELGLTDTQQAEIAQLRTESRRKMIETRMLLKDNRLNLKDVLRKYDSDRSEIDRITSEIKLLTAQLLDERVASILRLKEILNREQFEIFQEKVAAAREKRMGRREKGRRHEEMSPRRGEREDHKEPE
ncbi:MAG: hypothetical protein NOU37_06225 [Candidatus Brocadiales bacterium]|nr:hypothetical protein [Candidatus Bathyanammoxibius amoris]